MKIVRMNKGHVEALVALEKQCFHDPWSAQSLREELEREANLFLVAEEEDGAVLGYIGCQTVLDEGYITNVAVAPAVRRRRAASGVGARLPVNNRT